MPSFGSLGRSNSHYVLSHPKEERGKGKVCTIPSFTVPEYDRPTVGRVYFGAHILQLQPFSRADVIALLWVADQPAVVHPGLHLAVFVLPLSLLLLCMLDLPAQLHHERFNHHFCGVPLGNAVWGLIPPEPGCQ